MSIDKFYHLPRLYIASWKLPVGKCYEASTSVNYDSRVNLTSKLPIFMTLDYDRWGLIRSTVDWMLKN